MARQRFLGWRVVGAAFIAELVSMGASFSAFGVFVLPLAEHFETTRGVIASGIGVMLLVTGLLGPLLGRIIDRGPVKAMMLVGVCLLATGLFLTSRATTLLQAGAAFCGLAAVGTAMFGPLPAMAIVSNWFVRRRGLALGITVAGATAASMLAPPIAATLVDTVGWRNAIAALGIGAAVVALPVLALFIIPRPEEVGQAPDGDAVDPSAPATASAGPETRALLRDPRLWWISFGFALVFASPIVIGIHFIPYAEDAGLSRLRAATFFSVMAPFSLLGKVAFGAIADRIDVRRALWVGIALMSGGWVGLLAGPTFPVLLGLATLFGLGVGALGPIQGVIIGQCFGRGAFGRVMGIGGLAGLPIIAGSAPLVGFLFDATGTYESGFTLQLAALGVAAVCFVFVRVPASEPVYTTVGT
ncbi:MAG: MFS transporter [Myxococcota bacterium]|nr:MFS transporter [Myxococcota bacterium]